jgi:hypothetical protein
MAELTDLLKSVEKELTGKIKEIYEKKLEEHIENISSNLSDCYTKDYGKLDINESVVSNGISIELKNIQKFLSEINKGRYIIHWTYFDKEQTGGGMYRNYTRNYYVFDNFGDFITFTKNQSETFTPVHISGGYTASKYILPDILIDLIKKLPCIDWIYAYNSGLKKTNLTALQQIKLIAEDYYKRLAIKKNYNIETQTETKKEYKSIETQTELIQESNPEYIRESNPETDKSTMNNCQSIIKGNTLTIINYNEPELNLCDYLPKLKKDFEKNGRIIKDCNYTNIEKIHIIASDFVKITKYYQGIRYISILDCNNYKSMPHYLQQDLTYLSIDGEIKINIVPPSYL